MSGLLQTLARSRIVRTAFLLVAAYWGAAFFIPPTLLIQVLNYVLIAVAVAVTLAYFPDVMQAIQMDRIDRVAQLTLGISLSWVAVVINRSWVGLIRISDADWMRASPVIGFYVFLSILAGVLHITAPGAIDGTVPRKNWIRIGCAIAVGVLAAWLVVGLGFGETFPEFDANGDPIGKH